MLKKSQLLSVIGILIVSLSVGSMNAAYAQSAEADVFAVIKVKDPNGFIANIGRLVDKVEPGMGAMASGMILGQMQMILKNPEWTGMDKTGEYTAVVLNPMMYPQSPVALIVPVTGKDEYLNILSQSLTGGEEADGIYTFMQATQKEMFVAFTENAGILAENAIVAGQIKALVEEKSPVLTEAPAVKGQLTVSLPLSKILATVRPMIDGFKQMFLPGMGPEMPQEGCAQPEGAPPQPPEAVKNILLKEIDIALSLMEQMEKWQLGIDVQPEEGVRISKAVFAVEGSNIEKFMAAQSPQKSSLLGIIPADSAMIASGSINMTPEFKDWYIWVTEIMSSIDPQADATMAAKMAQWTADALEIFGGDVAFGALSQAEDSLVTKVLTLKDAPKAAQLVEQSPEMINAMAGMYKSMGLDLDVTLAGKEEYKGGEILNFDFGFNAENIPDPEGQEAFNKIFGETLSMPFGIIKNYGVLGFGKNARGQVRKMMEVLDSGADVAAEYTPAMFGLPEENNFFMYLSIPKVLLWAAKYAPETPPDFQIQESPGLGMTGRFVDTYLEGELFVPIAEILAIRNIAPQVMGKAPEEPMEEKL